MLCVVTKRAELPVNTATLIFFVGAGFTALGMSIRDVKLSEIKNV